MSGWFMTKICSLFSILISPISALQASVFNICDLVDTALVAAALKVKLEERVHDFQRGLLLGDKSAETQNVCVVVAAGHFRCVGIAHSAARMPFTLFAAMEMPMPVEQTSTP